MALKEQPQRAEEDAEQGKALPTEEIAPEVVEAPTDAPEAIFAKAPPAELGPAELAALLAQVAIDTDPGPKMPSVMQEMFNLQWRTDLQLREVVKIVEGEKCLSDKLLPVANSPYYSGRGQATTILQAVVRLGVDRTMQLLLAIATRDFIVGKQKLLRRRISENIERAYLAGLIAQELAVFDKCADAGAVFIRGFLHDLSGTYLLHSLSLLHDDQKIAVPKRKFLMDVVGRESRVLNDLIMAGMELPEHIGTTCSESDESVDAKNFTYVRQALFFSQKIVESPTSRIKFGNEARDLGITAPTFDLINDKRTMLAGLLSAYSR